MISKPSQLIVSLLLALGLFLSSPSAFAVVGDAEGFDEFEELNLEEFQQFVLDEERLNEMTEDGDYLELLQKKQAELEEVTEGELEEVLQEEIEELKKRLLQLPDRDRFSMELVGDYTYDSNIERNVPREEKGDSVFNVRKTAVIDLSGKKTDFRFDLSGTRQWNVVFSEKDHWQVEERMRVRRRLFKKLNTSFNSRVARHSSKTVEIDEKKVRWDFNNQLTVNYPFSRKLSINTTLGATKRFFPQEAFDQDSGWTVSAAPSAFWNITPKSRASLGYSFGANRSRIKSGDANSHEITLGYFGQITRKSSASLTLAYQNQIPRSEDTAESKTVTAGIGTIWQLTPKTQMSLQYTRALQNSTSDLASGEEDGENTTSKQDTHFVNENLSLSFNSRILRKVTAVLDLSAIHTKTKTFVDDDPTNDDTGVTRQFSFPMSLSVTYAIREWITLQLSYRFNFRTGNEKQDTNRAHTWFSMLRLTF